MDRTTGQVTSLLPGGSDRASMPEGFGDGREFKGVFDGAGEAAETNESEATTRCCSRHE